MNKNRRQPNRTALRLLRTTVAVLGTFAVLTIAAGDAQARSRKHDRGRGHRDRVEVVHVVHHDHARFARPGHGARRYVAAPAPVRPVVAPGRIRHERVYREYRDGRVYHRGHGHFHDVYRFPVRTSFGVAWTPYDYCDGIVFREGYFAVDGPRFHVRIGF